MAEAFAGADLELMRGTREVRIETSAHEGALVHHTVIWVVVDSGGRVLIRSYRGPTARWYREAVANPACRLQVGGRRLDVVAVPANDTERIAACTAELRRKYADSPSMPPMTREHLQTTLELLPR